MKRNLHSYLFTIAAFVLGFASNLRAQGFILTSLEENPTFNTTQQDWYQNGTSPTIGKDYLFDGAIQNFVDNSFGDPKIIQIKAKMGYAFDFFSDIKAMQGGKVDLNLPVKINYTYPVDRSFGCGDEIPIATTCTVNPGYNLNSLPPLFNMELGVKAKAGMYLGYKTAFNEEGIVDLAAAGQSFGDANGGNYESKMAGGENPFFGLNTQTGITWPWQYNGGTPPASAPPTNLPIVIPGFITNLTKLSGTIDNPFTTNPTDQISGKTLTEIATKKFLDIDFDPIQFQEYLTGFPMRKVVSVPGLLALDYSIFSVPLNFKVFQTQKLKFEPSVDIEMQLNRIYDYRVKDQSNAIVQTGTGNQVTMKAGYTLLLTVPVDNYPIAVTPTYKLKNQFTTQIRDSVRVSVGLEALKLTLSTPGVTLCNPFDDTDCVTIGAGSTTFGPVVDLNYDITNYAFDTYPSTTFEMGGFADVPGTTFTLQPDNAPPVATFSNPVLALNANGQVTVSSINQVVSSLIDADNGGVEIINAPTVVYDCSHLGNRNYVFVARDTRCNSKIYTAPVTIIDNLKPTALVVPAFTLPLNNSGQASVSVANIDNGSFDNCSIASRSLNRSNFTCEDLGPNTITLTVTDQSGNTQTASVVVTIVDNTKPALVCKNTAVSLNTAGSAGLSTGDVFQSGSDNCGILNLVSVQPNSFNCADWGARSVTLTANDGHGNTTTCSASVNVLDNIAPTVVCKTKVESYLNAAGASTITAAAAFQNGADNCSVVNLQSVLPNSFTCSNLGPNVATLTVNDGHGNTATCNTTVIVLDAIAPTMACKNVTLNLDASGQAILSPAQVNNGSFDNCTLSLLSLSQTNFNCAHLGNNTVVLTGTDQSSNTATCSATITVRDLIIPVAKCKDITADLTANGTLTLGPSHINNGSFDNCGFEMLVTPSTFNCANVGSNLLTLRATDASGNSATCTAAVMIRDVTPPNTLCKNATIYLDDSGHATLSVAQVDNGSSDACGISAMSISQTEFNCSKLEGSARIVTLLVKDVNNNLASCLAYVTVKDAIAPTAVCQNKTIVLASNGTATVYGASLAAESFDNCSVWSYAPVAKVYTSANLGNNNLTVKVKDWSQNSATCTSMVTVLPFGSGNSEQNRERAEQPENAAALADEFDLAIFPNPAAGDVTMSFDLPLRQPFTLRMFDLSGRLVWNQEAMGAMGENIVPLKLEGVAPGIYLVDFQSENIRQQRRLVVQR